MDESLLLMGATMASSDQPMESTGIRWGVLGTARTAQKRTIPAILRASHKIIAIAGRKEERLDKFKTQFGIEFVHKWDEVEKVLENPNVDAIYIPLPNALHAQWVVRSLVAGKHVLCEKPIALNLSEIDEIVAAALQSGRVVEEDFSYYLSPAYRYIEQLKTSGKITPLHSINIRYSFLATYEHHIRYNRLLGGGSFLDLGCYAVDFVHRLLNEELKIEKVRAFRPPPQQLSWGNDPKHLVDAECELMGHTPSGVLVKITTSFLDKFQQCVELRAVNGEKIKIPHAFRVECIPSEVIHKFNDGKMARKNFEIFDTDYEMLMAFAKEIAGSYVLESKKCQWERNIHILSQVEKLIMEQMDKQ